MKCTLKLIDQRYSTNIVQDIPRPLNLELYCDVVPKTCEHLIILYQIIIKNTNNHVYNYNNGPKI